MKERTSAEILQRMKDVEQIDFLGVIFQDLIRYLTPEEAKPFLKDDADVERIWKEGGYPLAKTPEAIKDEMLKYMPFAWEKANGCRGLSAARSIQHMQTWLWMLGQEDAAKQIDSYNNYGKPQLRAICEAFGWDWKQWDNNQWGDNEMEDFAPAPESVVPLIVQTQA